MSDGSFWMQSVVAGSLAISGKTSPRQVLIDGFIAPDKTAAPMFPLFENTSEWDEYGEVIIPDDYVVRDAEMMDYTNQHPVSFSLVFLKQYLHMIRKIDPMFLHLDFFGQRICIDSATRCEDVRTLSCW